MYIRKAQMMAKVLIADKVDEEGVGILRRAGFHVDYEPSIDHGKLLEVIHDYDVLIVRSRTKVTHDVIEAGRRLSIVGRAGAGLDNIDLEAAKMRGIKVLNSPDALTNAVAELVLGLMIAVARNVIYAHGQLSDGRWVKGESLGTELMGKTLGILGFGRIGRRLAEIARCLRMHVLANDIIEPPRELLDRLEVRLTSPEELFRSSDFISVHVPLMPETRGLVGERLLRLAKPSTILINTSRGSVVDGKALIKALEEGWIAAAAVDVYDREPPDPDLKLLKMRNVVHTPHIGSQTIEAQRRAITGLAEKIIREFGGEASSRERTG